VGLSLKIFDWGEIEQAGGMKVRQHVGLRSGLPDDLARKVTKILRDEFPRQRARSRATPSGSAPRARTTSRK